MKKLLLIAGALLISAGLYAQKAPAKVKMNVRSHSAQLFNIAEDVPAQQATMVSTQLVYQNLNKGTNDITVMDIGTSANAFGLYNGGRTALWADPNINSVAFFHRMAIPPGSGFIANDLSKDGGATWTVNNQMYAPVGDAVGRYPQGVLLNPVGNKDPNNAYAVNVNAAADKSNGDLWGGLGASSIKLDGTNLSQQSWSTTGAFRNNVPDAMTVNPVTGDVFVVEPSLIGGLGNQYVDTLVITRGSLVDNVMEWEQTLLYAPVNQYGTGVADEKIAFAPDGLIGYISTLSDNGEDDHATESAYYPILYKTTDGGLTWDENPIVVPLGGPDGLSAIVHGLMNDAQWAEFWGDPLPEREDIIYTTAFTHDLAVDANGNPVINVVIGVSGVHGSGATAYSILSSSGYFASYNIFSRDGGVTWMAQKLGDNLRQFRGTWFTADDNTEMSEDNRSQITSSFDGTHMFFSWLDTDFDQAEENTKPDIYCIGWEAGLNKYTDVVNVTFLSDAWLQAYMGTASCYAFGPADGYEHIIPFVYQEMTVVNNTPDPGSPVQYKYISDFKFTAADYFWVPITVKEVKKTVAGISQNYPNPAKDLASVKVTLTKSAKVSLEVFNILGQKVYEIAARDLSEGTHQLDINVKALKAGVYTYSVIANGERSNRKMMVN